MWLIGSYRVQCILEFSSILSTHSRTLALARSPSLSLFFSTNGPPVLWGYNPIITVQNSIVFHVCRMKRVGRDSINSGLSIKVQSSWAIGPSAYIFRNIAKVQRVFRYYEILERRKITASSNARFFELQRQKIRENKIILLNIKKNENKK